MDVTRTERLGERGTVRVARRQKNHGPLELSRPYRCEIVFDGGKTLTVRFLEDTGIGWAAGESYRCPAWEFVPDVPLIGNATTLPNSEWCGPVANDRTYL